MIILGFLYGQCEIVSKMHSCFGHHPCSRNHEYGEDEDEIHI